MNKSCYCSLCEKKRVFKKITEEDLSTKTRLRENNVLKNFLYCLACFAIIDISENDVCYKGCYKEGGLRLLFKNKGGVINPTNEDSLVPRLIS